MEGEAQIVIAVAFGVVSVLYQIDSDPGAWAATEQGSIYASREQLQRFITNPDSVEKWFNLVSLFKAADSRPLGVGKKYQAIYDLPLIGEYTVLLTVVEYKANTLVVLDSTSLLRPHFTIRLEDNGPNTTRLTFSTGDRQHYSSGRLGSVLRFLTGQQLQRSLFMIRMMFPF
ncbi:hypothetical protein GWK47_010993 [Chionoecetes opilio]|uniref:Uncharacterized protein n=1 Tax=Chionoecetes opilio TaxID=41210 RepID=A0A8J4Y335_CHIOP|nr:hypothetical protein GWK47_010993 [Chionoecetes opilio]